MRSLLGTARGCMSPLFGVGTTKGKRAVRISAAQANRFGGFARQSAAAQPAARASGNRGIDLAQTRHVCREDSGGHDSRIIGHHGSAPRIISNSITPMA